MNYLIYNEQGMLLRTDSSTTSFSAVGDDNTIWQRQGDSLVSVATGHCVDFDGSRVDDTAVSLTETSDKLPSAHLAELYEYGITVLPNVMSADGIANMKALCAGKRASRHADETPTDGFFWMMGGLSWCPDLVRAVSHPVALWIMREFMTEDIHYCHQPVITTLKPAKEMLGTFPEEGWHADYPYHPGVFPDEQWPEEPALGVQYNICVDPFRADNGATQYVPGSHKVRAWPPREFNLGGTHMGEGQHKDVTQIVAPAGAAALYDSRTWHRRCDELNVSGEDRIAILNAVTPSWVLPMMDKSPVGDRYIASDIPGEITQREREEIERLCLTPMQPTPEGMPKLDIRLAARGESA